jgi:hypothetical protein
MEALPKLTKRDKRRIKQNMIKGKEIDSHHGGKRKVSVARRHVKESK